MLSLWQRCVCLWVGGATVLALCLKHHRRNVRIGQVFTAGDAVVLDGAFAIPGFMLLWLRDAAPRDGHLRSMRIIGKEPVQLECRENHVLPKASVQLSLCARDDFYPGARATHSGLGGDGM